MSDWLRRITIAVLAGLSLAASSPGSGGTPGPVTPAAQRRGVEQTFLTFPEWFLVFSPAEYAQLVRTKTPDQFVFWGHIGQFWKSYAAVTAETWRRHDEPNPGYHLMIIVIGTSTTVEYALRSFYETLIGRVSAALAGGQLTDEDRYAAQVAQEYVDFIRVEPWYEFDFWTRLKGLWSSVPMYGAHPVRKWERRYALTTEYVVKAIYAKLIEKATRTVYEPPKDVTAVVLERPPCARGASIRELSESPDGRTLVLLPRYQPFTAAAMTLAQCGAQFREIAGNDSVILVSTVGPAAAPAFPQARLLFSLPILTQHGLERRAYVVPVRDLGTLLRTAGASGFTVEHIFDY